jgi:hypothetical protein
LTISPVQNVSEQLDLLDSEENHYMNPDARLLFYFEDGALIQRTSEVFIIGEVLLNKLKNLFKNLHFTWLQFFFREIIDRRVLTEKSMPEIEIDDDDFDEDGGDEDDEGRDGQIGEDSDEEPEVDD